MALSDHLETLQNRHGDIDAKIDREMRSPMPDHLRISQLKREKLQIKDTLAQFQSTQDR